MTEPFDPLVPRPIDLPTEVDLTPGADLSALDDAKIIAAPADRADRNAWRQRLAAWRDDAGRRYRYDGSHYDTPGREWTRSCYSVALVWLWDGQLYDPTTGRFTPDNLVRRGIEDFGGYDAVVLWHAYPVIGIDRRNQFDFYRDVPGLNLLVDAFHRLGVRVFLDYNPWDTGTRRSAGTDAEEFASLIGETGADGAFLDTLKEGAPEFTEALEKANPAVAFEGESRLPMARIADHALSWAQWFADTEAPGVLRARWFERRHQLHHTRRWNRDHSDELQSAWVNGAGMLVWESVFSAWVGWNARDRATLRRMVTVQRALSAVLVDGDWTPLTPDVPGTAERAGVYGSRFELVDVTLWTLVNRSEDDFVGVVLHTEDMVGEWYDVTTGIRVEADEAGVHAVVPARGVLGVVRVGGTAGARARLAVRSMCAARRLHVPDASFPVRRARRLPAGRAYGELPDAVAVPGGEHELTVRFRRRETGLYDVAPYVEEWKPLPPRLHDPVSMTRSVTLAPVRVARLEVSNAEYAEFVTATGYRPTIEHRFLAHWVDGEPVPGTEDEPVTFVDLADARAYAIWRGARLPTEDEWQLATPCRHQGRREPLVWNWTESEHDDGRSRFAILKGGSAYAATGSDWYADGGPQPPDVSFKLVLTGAGLDRSEAIGFRIAVDVRP